MTNGHVDWRSLHGEHFAQVRVLVTGGAGFIGSHLVDALCALGAQVVVLDDLSTGSQDNLPGNTTRLIQGSILDTETVANAMDGCRFVFHEAAAVSVAHSVEDPLLFHEINGRGMLNVLEAAREHQVQRVMFAASSSAYGDSELLPKVETMPPLPKSPYAATKLYGEALCRAYAASYGLDSAALRYFNIFGPRQKSDSPYSGVIAAFARRLLNGEPPIINGDGSHSRDFTYVANAVHANLLAARSPQPIGGEAINVGTARQIDLNQLASMMASLVNRQDLKTIYAPPRVGDVLHSLADIGKARQVLGFTPLVGFEEGLAATMAWYKSTLGSR